MEGMPGGTMTVTAMEAYRAIPHMGLSGDLVMEGDIDGIERVAELGNGGRSIILLHKELHRIVTPSSCKQS